MIETTSKPISIAPEWHLVLRTTVAWLHIEAYALCSESS
jgi:hypothetical protein